MPKRETFQVDNEVSKPVGKHCLIIVCTTVGLCFHSWKNALTHSDEPVS